MRINAIAQIESSDDHSTVKLFPGLPMPSLFAFLDDLNAFKNDALIRRNEYQRLWQIHATRIYILLLILCLAGLTSGLWLTKIMTKVIINNPTIDQVANLSMAGQCPCSHLAISYSTFITLDIDLHPVCTSDFMTDRWIEAIFPPIDPSWVYRADFRASASAQFLLLRSLCQLSNRHFQDHVFDFYATSLISPQALSQSVLFSTLEASISKFHSTVLFTFQTQLNLINEIIFSNKWINGLQTIMQTTYLNSEYQPDYMASLWLYYFDENGVMCLCQRTYDCGINTGIYESTLRADEIHFIFTNPDRLLFSLPNFYAGCMPMDMLLRSSLECFYNQTCIDLLVSQVSPNQTFTAIQFGNDSRFAVNETLKMIVNAMMISNWSQIISHEKYFQKCAPKFCIYSISQRRTILSIINKVIGLLGGMILVLRTIISLCLRALDYKKNSSTGERPMVFLRMRMVQWFSAGRSTLIRMNHFKRRGLNRGLVQHQIIGTRAYLVILLLSTMILSMYIFLTEDDQRKTLFNPTESTYTLLLKTHPTSLNCQCSKVSIDYEQFITLTPVYHSICSSSYVSDDWLNYTNTLADNTPWEEDNIPFNIGIPFQITATICEYSRKSIEEALKLLFQNQLVTSQVTSPVMFFLQMQAIIDTWISDTINQFQLEIDLIRIISEGNKYSNFLGNFRFEINSTTSGVVDLVPLSYQNCSCVRSQSCYEAVTLRNIRLYIPDESSSSMIDDFFTGCLYFESLAQSSFACFYNQTCVAAVQHQLEQSFEILPIDFMYNMTAMNSSKMDDDATHEIIGMILDRLMIDQWKSNVSFHDYFNTCAPLYCTYEYRSRRSMIITCLTVISVIGGLSTAIEILILVLIRTAEKIIQHNQRFTVKGFFTTLFYFRTEEQIINRVHFVFLILLLGIFYFVSFLPSHQITIQTNSPSFSTYKVLLKEYSTQSFECSCTKLSISYETFLVIQPHYHEICSSIFVSDNWLKYVYEKTNPFLQFNQTDFYRTAYGQYQLLTAFCQLSRQTVNSGLERLNKTLYINAQLLTSEALRQEVQNVIERFQKTTSRLFVRLMNFVREITEGNMLLTLYGTNWKIQDLPVPTSNAHVATEPVFYDSCNCGTSTKCTKSSRNRTTACYPLEALLHSSLYCFYDQQCIDPDGLFPALNRSKSNTRFNINTTVEKLLDDLMIEQYEMTWSYENYFHECSISTCSYSYLGRENIIDIVTSLLGLYGGLMIISEWITLFFVRLYLYRNKNRLIHVSNAQ